MTGERSADLELALDAVVEAGSVVLGYFGTDPEVTHKTPTQPLTDADIEADRLLKRRLCEARPDYGWLSEETPDRPDRLERERVWIVDPIDGTRSFIAGHAEFAISVGLVEDGEAIAGVVYNPATDEAYWADRGAGAFGAVLPAAAGGGSASPDADLVESLGGRDVRRLTVTASSTEDQTVMLASRGEIGAGEFDPFHGGWQVEPIGSTAYKLAKIAAGEGDVYLSRGPKSEWDVCAGTLLIEEAGGRATDLYGRRVRYNRRDPHVHGIVGTNGAMHDYILGIVESLPPPSRPEE